MSFMQSHPSGSRTFTTYSVKPGASGESGTAASGGILGGASAPAPAPAPATTSTTAKFTFGFGVQPSAGATGDNAIRSL